MASTQNYDIPLPQFGEPADIRVIDQGTEKIDNIMHGNRTMIAPGWVSTETYNTGNRVVYLGEYYKCKEDNVTGAWDATKWDKTTVGEDIEGLGTGGESALVDLDDVEITSPADGQALIYNEDDEVWENQTLPDPSVTKTATGNPIELTDAASAPLVKCVTQITGSQDLHGYDKPWVGGAGKNKFDDTLIVSPSATAQWIQVTLKPNTNYTVSSNIPYFSTSAYIFAVSGTDTSGATSATDGVGLNTPRTVTADSNGIISFAYRNNGGSGVLNLTQYHYQIEEGSTATSYEPYSNICPITAYTEGEIEVGANAWDQASEVGSYSRTTGERTSSVTTLRNVNYMSVEGGQSYYFKSSMDDSIILLAYQADGTYIGTYAGYDNWVKTGSAEWCGNKSILMPSKCAKLNFILGSNYGTTYKHDIFIYKVGSLTTHTTTYPSAIYRGSEDCVEGTETHDRKYIDSNITSITRGSLDSSGLLYRVYNNSDIKTDINQNPIFLMCNKYEVVSLGECRDRARNGEKSCCAYGSTVYIGGYVGSESDLDTELLTIQFAYEITPTTSSVTPTNLPIKSLSGYNHIESSTGEMKVEYITEEYQPIVDLIQSSSHVYSAAEQVVGKWIDGRVLYEQTLHYTESSEQTGKTYNISSIGADYVFLTNAEVKFGSSGGNDWYSAPYYYNASNFATVSVNNSGLVVRVLGWGYTEVYATIRYTKTAQTRSLSAPVTSQKAKIEPLTDKTEEVPTEEEKTVETPETEEEDDER